MTTLLSNRRGLLLVLGILLGIRLLTAFLHWHLCPDCFRMREGQWRKPCPFPVGFLITRVSSWLMISIEKANASEAAWHFSPLRKSFWLAWLYLPCCTLWEQPRELLHHLPRARCVRNRNKILALSRFPRKRRLLVLNVNSYSCKGFSDWRCPSWVGLFCGFLWNTCSLYPSSGRDGLLWPHGVCCLTGPLEFH